MATTQQASGSEPEHVSLGQGRVHHSSWSLSSRWAHTHHLMEQRPRQSDMLVSV